MNKRILSYGWVALLLVVLGACANMAQGPTGGKADVTPPECLGSNPKDKALNVSNKRIEIQFNEFLQLNNPSKELVVSPPQKISPSAKAIGKKIVVELRDSLQPNTTYTFDFGNSIGDYTENNKVNNFLYSFSTGDHIDSLTISGIVLNAETLVPEEEVTVGIYSDETDSLFTTKKFERIGKTNAEGRFTIRGVAGQKYRIFALRDMNNNHYFDQSSEAIAVQELPMEIPALEVTEKIDTVYGDSMKIDTIITHKMFNYKPDDVVLRLFEEEQHFQKFDKIERPDRRFFSLYFERMENSIPKVNLVDTMVENWYVTEASLKADTVKYWFTDSALVKKDTVRIAVSYQKTDSAGALIPAVDTLKASLSAGFLKNEAKTIQQQLIQKKKAEKRNRPYKRTNLLNVTPFSLVEVYDQPTLEWQNPIASLDESKIHLYLAKDTTKSPLPFSVSFVESRANAKAYKVNTQGLDPEETYVLEVDSACAYDYYGNHNDPILLRFRKKGESEYAKLTLRITNVEGPAFVELLKASDTPIRKVAVKNGEAFFDNIPPSTYFARLILDANNNQTWDTGKYEDGLLPECVYYFPKAMKMRANWEMTEDWDVKAEPLDKQRPAGLASKKKKNKNN